MRLAQGHKGNCGRVLNIPWYSITVSVGQTVYEMRKPGGGLRQALREVGQVQLVGIQVELDGLWGRG